MQGSETFRALENTFKELSYIFLILFLFFKIYLKILSMFFFQNMFKDHIRIFLILFFFFKIYSKFLVIFF